ncbi:MAG: hypothetical protein VCC04_11470, partial [Myxococcota bacterium]
MSGAAVVSAAESGDSPVRHALRRLWVYVLRNRAYYAGWAFLTLVYVVAFVAVPILVGWAIQGALSDDISPQEMTFRFATLMAVALIRGVLRFYSRYLVFTASREVEYEMR